METFLSKEKIYNPYSLTKFTDFQKNIYSLTSQKMNDISTHFCLIEPNLIKEDLRLGSQIYKPHSSPQFQCNSKVIFDQHPEKSDAGTSWSQTFRGVTPDSSIMEWNGRRAYIGVFRTDGSLIIIGSPTEVPLITVTPNVGVFVVESTFETVNPAVI